MIFTRFLMDSNGAVMKGASMNDFEFSDDVKFWLTMIGYVGGCVALSYVMYKWFAGLVGTAVAKELIKAGIIIVA